MAKKRKGYRNHSNRAGGVSIIVIILLLLGIIGFKCIELREKNDNLKKEEAARETDLQEEQARTKEIEELRKYVQTRQFQEEKARELGFVYPDEFVYKEKEAE